MGSDEKVASQLKKMITPIVIKRLSAKKRSVSDAFLDDKEKFKRKGASAAIGGGMSDTSAVPFIVADGIPTAEP